MSLNCALKYLIVCLAVFEVVAANAPAEDWVVDRKTNEVNGLMLTLVEKVPQFEASADGVPQKALFLQWENVGKDAILLGGLFETACASGQVFVKGPDGTHAPDRQYREQGHWAERRIESGKSIGTGFNPWFWVQKPQKPGKYEIWVVYEVTKESLDPAHVGAVPVGHWQGKIVSNRLELELK